MTTRRTLLASTIAIAALARGGNAATQEATPVVQSETGVVYGDFDGTQLLLDVYRPANISTPQPAILLFHGGGMAIGDRTWMAEQAQALAESGYVAFTIDYRLIGDDGSNTWPTQLDDAQRAVRWVRANAERLGIDPDRVGAYGHSSGEPWPPSSEPAILVTTPILRSRTTPAVWIVPSTLLVQQT